MTHYTPREARERLGLSQADLARRLQWGQPHLSRLETGQRRWTLRTAMRWSRTIARYLDTHDCPLGFNAGRVPSVEDLDTYNQEVRIA